MENFSSIKNFDQAADLLQSLSKNAKNEVLESYISLNDLLVFNYKQIDGCYPIPITEETAELWQHSERILFQKAKEYFAWEASRSQWGFVEDADHKLSLCDGDVRKRRAKNAGWFLNEWDWFYDGYDEDGLAQMLLGEDRFILSDALVQNKVDYMMAPSFEDAGQLIWALCGCIDGAGNDIGGKIDVDACRKLFQDLVITILLLKWSKDESDGCRWRHQVAKTLLNK